eukprot:scaffold7123_cov119-Isochrysis_galbana.AAC.11
MLSDRVREESLSTQPKSPTVMSNSTFGKQVSPRRTKASFCGCSRVERDRHGLGCFGLEMKLSAG